MRVAIAGAGAVGRSIARELIANDHQVLLIDKDPRSIRPERVPDAEWLLASKRVPPHFTAELECREDLFLGAGIHERLIHHPRGFHLCWT